MAKAFLVKGARSLGAPEPRDAARPDDPTADLDLVAVVRRGMKFTDFEKIVERSALGYDEAARALGIATRTLARRKAEKKLDPASSERVIRLAKVLWRAVEVLGDDDAMRAWIRAPNAALGGQTPLSLLDTDVGTSAVLTVLGRIEHGVFS